MATAESSDGASAPDTLLSLPVVCRSALWVSLLVHAEQQHTPVLMLGLAGFCMGGALALLGCITGAPIDAAVAFYGRPEGGDVRTLQLVQLLQTVACLAAGHWRQPGMLTHASAADADAWDADAAVQGQGASARALGYRGRLQGLRRPSGAPAAAVAATAPRTGLSLSPVCAADHEGVL